MSAQETKSAPVVTPDESPEPVLERCAQCGHYAVIWMYGCCKPCVQAVEQEAARPQGQWW